MPAAHIWIRKEDIDKWNTIKDKPEWLHEHLNQKYEIEYSLKSKEHIRDNNLIAISKSEPNVEPFEEGA